MATFQDIFGSNIPPGLLTSEQEAALNRRAQSAGLTNLGFALLQASSGQPGQAKPSLGQIIGQAGPVGLQAYQQASQNEFGNILKGIQIRQSLQQANTPKYMTLKSGDNEVLVQIPAGGGTPQPVTIPGMQGGSAIKFDAETLGFANLIFGKPFNQLDPAQQRQVIEFSLAPDDTKMAELRTKSLEVSQNIPGGQMPPLPKSRREIISEALAGLQNRPAAPAVAPPPAAAPAAVTPPAAQPSVKQMSAPASDVTGGMIKTSATVQLPSGMAEKPLAENETPLINSKGISPKQRSELEILKPQSFTSVETALNTTRQIRSEINRLLENPSFNLAFGFGGETISGVYTPAADIRAKLDQIKNQLFVEGITALRNASPTGAGVGSVTNQEGGRFENLRGALVQFQSADQARAELARIEKELEASERRIENGFTRVYGTTKFDVSPLYTPSKKGDLRGILFPGKKK